jgi:hypothetical protein
MVTCKSGGVISGSDEVTARVAQDIGIMNTLNKQIVIATLAGIALIVSSSK